MSNVINININSKSTNPTNPTKAPVGPVDPVDPIAADRARVRDLLAEAVVHVFVGGPQTPIVVTACNTTFAVDREVAVEEIEDDEQGNRLFWIGSLGEWQDALARALSAAANPFPGATEPTETTEEGGR